MILGSIHRYTFLFHVPVASTLTDFDGRPLTGKYSLEANVVQTNYIKNKFSRMFCNDILLLEKISHLLLNVIIHAIIILFSIIIDYIQ